MSRKKDRRAIRAAIVRAAAKRCGRKVEEIFILALPDVHDVEVNLNRIPDEVVRYARKMLQARHRAHPRPRVIRERYYHATPCMDVC
jgi:hypothetical protein